MTKLIKLIQGSRHVDNHVYQFSLVAQTMVLDAEKQSKQLN